MNDKPIELNGKQLAPRELTLREMERVLGDLGSGKPHLIETIVPEEPVSALAIAISVDIESPDALLDLTPTLIKDLAAQVREKNPSLARAVKTLGALASKAIGDFEKEIGNLLPAESSTASADPPAG